MSDQLSTFGQRLRYARRKKNITQVSLGRSLGYKTGVSITNLETGLALHIPIPVLAKLAEVLDVDLHWLITGTTPARDPAPADYVIGVDLAEPVADESIEFVLPIRIRIGGGPS